MSVEDDLAAARRGMAILWDEISTGRTHVADIIHKVRHLMSIHDDTKALLAEISTDVDALIGAKGDGDATIADLKADATALRDKIKAALGSGNAPSDAQSSAFRDVVG